MKAIKVGAALIIGIGALYALMSFAGLSAEAFISDEMLSAGSGLAAIAGLVLGAIAILAVLALLLNRPRRVLESDAPSARKVPNSDRLERAIPPAQPREPITLSLGARKIVGALVLGAITFASTLVAFGRVDLAAVVAGALMVCSFIAYTGPLDRSMDNVLGLFLVAAGAIALTLILVALGDTVADAVGASPTTSLIWAWAVSIPVAMGIHMLIVSGAPSIRADTDLPPQKRGLVFAGVVLSVVAIVIALASGVIG